MPAANTQINTSRIINQSQRIVCCNNTTYRHVSRGKMLRKGLTIFVALFAFFCGTVWYNAYLPISPKLVGNEKLIPFLFNFNGRLSEIVGDKLGIVPKYKVFRWFFNAFASISSIRTNIPEDLANSVTIKDTTILGIPVKIFRPKAAGPGKEGQSPPAIIFIHGGALSLGSINWETYIHPCIMLAQGTKSVVISVEYRLAPEHAFPAQFDDAYAVVQSVTNEPSQFGIRPNKIALVGDSAGGMLCAAISLEFAKQNRSHKLVAQVLIYPWLQLIDMLCLPSYQENKRGFQMDEKQVAYFMSLVTVGNEAMEQEYLIGNVTRYFTGTPQWKFLEIPDSSNCHVFAEGPLPNLPHSFVQKVLDPRMSPLLADSLEGSPATMLVIAEYDLLVSENTLFAKRLRNAGIPLVSNIYKSYHAFLFTMSIPVMNDAIAQQAMEDIFDFLNSVFYTKS